MVPTTILLDGAGRPLRDSIQQNDARAVHEIEEMKQAIDPDEFFTRTGGSINQQSVAPKLRWLARHEPECLSRAETVLGSYDYITARLTGSLSVERNWALEAGFMDLGRACLHDDLVRLAGIGPEHLPPLRASHEVTGHVTTRAAAETGLAAGTPVAAGCADHIASAFVAGAAEDGDLVVKFGGAGDIMLSCREAVTDPRMFIDFHIVPGLHFSNGCMAASGSMLNWIVRHLARAESAEAREAGQKAHALLDRQAEEIPPGRGRGRSPALLPGREDAAPRPLRPGYRGRHGASSRPAPPVAGGAGSGCLRLPSPCGRLLGDGSEPPPDHRVRRRRGQRPLACRSRRMSSNGRSSVSCIIRAPASAPLSLPVWGRARSTTGSAIARYVRPERSFEPEPCRLPAYRDAYGVYRDLYRRLQSLYPRLGALPPA